MRRGTLPAAGGSLVLAVVLAAVVAGRAVAPHDPLLVDLGVVLRPPGDGYLLGTDHLGRCVWSRLLAGARVSVGLSLLASLGSIGLGMIVGMTAAWLGRRVDAVVRGFIDIGLGFPGLALALVIGTAAGPGLVGITIGLAAAGAPWWARFGRDLTRVALTREFVTGGRVAGVSGWRLFRHYLLPQLVPVVAVSAAWRSGLVLGALTGFSYLGLGAAPPTPEWGAMLQEGRMYSGDAFRLVLAPAVATSLAVGGFVLVAEGLRDLLAVREPMQG